MIRIALNLIDSGLACAPTGGLRLCPHIYNTESHIDRAIAGVKEAAAI